MTYIIKIKSNCVNDVPDNIVEWRVEYYSTLGNRKKSKFVFFFDKTIFF